MSSAGTDAEKQLCSGFGFYLQVGGAARKAQREEKALDLCMQRGKKLCV